jgi:histidinol-phosphate aminotransferase
MHTLNRRHWLRLLSLAGAAAAAPRLSAAAASNFPAYLPRLFDSDTPARLGLNENPYGPSPKVREAMVRAFDDACRYPSAYTKEIAQIIAEKEGVKPEHIVLTAGSSEGLKAAGLAFGMHGGEIVSPDPTFHVLMNYAEQMGAHVHRVPLTKEMGHDLEAMEKRVHSNTRLVFVCNPNNPTGTLIPAQQMRDFCRALAGRAIVFADEAYFDYIAEPGYPSMVELVKQDYNVIVSRTLSKVYGLAGVRVGYLIARPDIARRLSEYCMAGLSVLAVSAAKAALEDSDFYRFSLQRNTEAKAYACDLLDSMGLRYVPSHANFVFFESGKDINQLNAAMMQENVQVGRAFMPYNRWCRVSTGTMPEMERFGKALKKLI